MSNNSMKKKTIKLDLIFLVMYIIGYFNYRDSSKCIIFMNKEVCVYDLILAAAIGVFVVGHILDANNFKEDPLRKEIGLCPGCDYWSVLHASLYFAMGCLFPGRYLAFFMFGVVWEMFEYYNGTHQVYLFGNRLNADTDDGEKWWYGRALDIAVNMFGYILGNYYINGNLTVKSLKEEFTFK